MERKKFIVRLPKLEVWLALEPEKHYFFLAEDKADAMEFHSKAAAEEYATALNGEIIER